ncbi:uncharacterized protein LOC143287541 isoform X2 [Babylonia areolata]|uniref:uncharacterized protein LOC143287541 isoform X2 n=1 Tax=Babylonia areolata TaxID=304850 RepID=UPI003FD0DEBB
MDLLLGFLIFIITVSLILAYRILRPLFTVQVNCWFCNHDTQVPFGNRNCWDCPHCEQYNGFTTDGDYNKPVPAQYMEDINHPINCRPAEFLTRCQFLCPTCQRNQLLKVKQLAAFEPLNEATYDEELTFYKHHLEKVYALCLSCDAVVKRELERLDESLNQQQDVFKDVPFSADTGSVETESTTAVHRTVPVLQYVTTVVSVITTVCTVLMVGVGMDSYQADGMRGWLSREVTEHVDRLGVSLCGVLLCVLSKLLHGKQRLLVEDAVHIVLWLVVVLTSLLLSPHVLDICLSVLLLTLELALAFKHRQLTNVSSPIMKRLSLEGGAPAANSDAVSEAVSSVSTSCRQQFTSPFLDSSNGPGVPVMNTLSGKIPSAHCAAHGLTANVTCEAANKEDLDDLGKELGAVLIAPHSSESGYSTARSSAFNSSAFGPVTQASLSSRVAFPRPLISPARLGVVSFSQTGLGRSSLTSSKASQPSILFGGVQEHRGGRVNPFLMQESRPLSMFSCRMPDRSHPNIPNLMSRCQTPLSSTSLLSPSCGLGTRLQTKAFSEMDFPVFGLKPSLSKTMSTWWKSSASDIFENRCNQPQTYKNRDNQNDKCDSSVLTSHAVDKEGVTGGSQCADALQTDMSPTECDSTTPLLSQLNMSLSSKKRKKKINKRRAEEMVDNFVFSDDDEDEDGQMFTPNQSSVSTVVLQSKQDWGWLQWLMMGVMVLSVFSNIFLTWTVLASRT